VKRFGVKEVATTTLLVLATAGFVTTALDLLQRSHFTPALEQLEQRAAP
jgi:hypothetical protein